MLDTRPNRPAALGPLELVRWLWRQLTSMRTALMLLFLLTLAALPGSLVPQSSVDPARVAQFISQHPKLSAVYEPLSLFSVYSAPWFAAIYLLLFVSLVGCVLPRTLSHVSAIRARPPAAPRHLDRLPVHESWTTDEDVSSVVASARTVLRGRRFRVAPATTSIEDTNSVAAERGHWRETGNLIFHLSMLLILVSFAAGNLFGFRADVLVVEGEGFSNTVTAYDTFSPGAAFDESNLAPFTVTLDALSVRYQPDGKQRGAPRDFRAEVTYTTSPDAAEQRIVLEVNHPLVIDGTKVFLLGNGYAPVFTVRDATGEEVFSGPVPFLPKNSNMTSTGVVKVPGASPDQLGFEGLFLPTAVLDPRQGPVSVFPDTKLPRAVLTAWTGSLGLDDGTPQSVYTLDKSQLRQVTSADGQPLAQSLAPGATMTLPDGSSITFDGIRRWTALKVARNPATTPALGGALLALAGLMLSLYVRRRRVWVRVSAGEGGRTLVEVAGLARSEGESRDVLAEEVSAVSTALRGDGKVSGDG